MDPCTVVTGASGALGEAVVSGLVERGHKVIAVATPRSALALHTLAARLGRAVTPLPAEFDDAFPEALSMTEAATGPITGAALVAGAWKGGGALHELDDSVYRDLMNANVDTVYRALRALLPGMVARGNGSIVVIGSRAAEQPWTSAKAAVYAASKAAAVAMAQAVAAEVVEKGVRVNAVLPSTIDTPANRSAMPKADFSAWVSTRSLTEVIAFLLSDAAKDVSGAALPVYGRS